MITLNTTYQQNKSLVDPVTNTYQTVLTIDPSVDQGSIVGTYNCTVKNDRGESSETVVVPGESWILAPTCLLFLTSSVCLCVYTSALCKGDV